MRITNKNIILGKRGQGMMYKRQVRYYQKTEFELNSEKYIIFIYIIYNMFIIYNIYI